MTVPTPSASASTTWHAVPSGTSAVVARRSPGDGTAWDRSPSMHRAQRAVTGTVPVTIDAQGAVLDRLRAGRW